MTGQTVLWPAVQDYLGKAECELLLFSPLKNISILPFPFTSSSLISDLWTVYGTHLVPQLTNKPAVYKLLKEGKTSRNKRTKTLSMWAFKLVNSQHPTGEGAAK